MADFKVYNPLTHIINRINNMEKETNTNDKDKNNQLGGDFLPLTGGTMLGSITQPISPSNSFDLVNKDYVDKKINVGDATESQKGILCLKGDLTGNANFPEIANGVITNAKLAPCSQFKNLKGSSESSTEVEDLILGSGFTMNGKVLSIDSNSKLPFASPTTKGILQLSGDLSGNANNPLISNKAITNLKLANLTDSGMLKGSSSNSVEPTDIELGNGLIMNNSKLDIDLTQIVTLPIPVNQGGTGHTSFTNGYLKGNDNSISVINTIPVDDIVGAVSSVNGVFPNKEGNVNVIMGNVTTGILSDLPSQPQSNGSMFVVSGDPQALHNGRTFVSDGDSWNEITFNLTTTDARYLLKGGDTLEGNLTVPAGTSILISDLPKQDNDSTNKKYVDDQIKALNILDATSSNKGILKLSGDLSGNADIPVIKNGVISNVKLTNMTDVSQIKGSLNNSKAVVDIGIGNGLKMDNSKLVVDTNSLSNVFLPLTGGQMFGTVTQPFSPVNLDDLTNKSYVDTQVNSVATPDASNTIKGKIQLNGDLTGTSSSPRINNLAITNAKMANMSGVSQLKGSSSNNSTVTDINVGHGLSVEDNTLYGSVSFFSGNNPNLNPPENRPTKNDVIYIGSDGSLWIWSGTLSNPTLPAAPGSQYSRGPGALNVIKSQSVYTILPTAILSLPITLTDFNIQVPSGSKVKLSYTLNFQNSGKGAPSFGWSGIHQTLDFFQASIIGFFGTSNTTSSFSTIYQVNKSLTPPQTGGADLYALAPINASNTLLASTLNLNEGLGGQAIPVHIIAYYENNSGSLTTLGLLFNRDLKTTTGNTIQIAGGIVDYTFY
ncbi:hypothetical protein IIV22A_146L [Invertebrate iridescent virus 22]|uniref:Uncharacterized protein n=1 Tax=Invertebrate iridescent virus 22 TaxID=345198 RepID=W8W2D0_9VIRU|nr:hypothetical protein IIV22A_146L [Invertebrate iridescent virus 22]CCV01990.1 hypothetical protein IIV22A_146L [Invertebrate iridescent virus 22]